MKKQIAPIILFTFLFAFASYAESVDLASTAACRQKWDSILANETIEAAYTPLINLCGTAFRKKLLSVIKHNKAQTYTEARHFMFSDLDNNDGTVCSVYDSRCIRTRGIPDPEKMNCEHTWPQSRGAEGIAKSDIHHLYPVSKDMNSRRNNHPFCEVVTPIWTGGDAALGAGPSGVTCFKPPRNHVGNVARSMFYFSVRYDFAIDAEQEKFFRKWNENDGVDEVESDRNSNIESWQNNRNPFVDHPSFAGLIDNF
jgi:endonuclease I